MKLNQENINDLIENKSNFVRFSQGIEEMFNGPSAYFYLQSIKTIKENNYKELFSNDHFIEYLYATLACWGMHRMDRKTRMTEFKTFKDSILKNKELFIELSKEKLREVDIEKIREKILKIFRTLNLMSRENAPKLVANSKMIHFLLPNLAPPMDKGNVIYFFYGKDRINKKGKTVKSTPTIKNEGEVFVNILREFQKIANKLDLSEKDLKNKWDTSIPKLIDNAIIGYNLNKSIDE